MKVKKAVIPCAGLGTRFLPYTKACPKEMLPIIDTPVLQLIVEEIVAAGITDILIIDNQRKQTIKGHFDKDATLEEFLISRGGNGYAQMISEISSLANFSYVQQEVPLGSAHAISLCEEFAAGEPFALLFGDDLIKTEGAGATAQLCEVFERTNKTVIGCQSVAMENIPKYSSVAITSTDEFGVHTISDIIEKPDACDAPSNIAGLGRYVLAADVFDYIKKTPTGAGGEYQITDTFQLMAKDGLVVAFEYAGRRYDTGNKSSYLEAVVDYALANEELSDAFKEYIKKVAEKL